MRNTLEEMRNFVKQIIEEELQKAVLAYLKEEGFCQNQILLQEKNQNNSFVTKIDLEVTKLLPSSSLLCNINGNTNDDIKNCNCSMVEHEKNKVEENHSVGEYENRNSSQQIGFDQKDYETPFGKDLGYNKSSFDIDDGGFGGEVYAYDGRHLAPLDGMTNFEFYAPISTRTIDLRHIYGAHATDNESTTDYLGQQEIISHDMINDKHVVATPFYGRYVGFDHCNGRSVGDERKDEV